MKLIVAVVLALLALSHAASIDPEKTLLSEYNLYPEGNYEFKFETEKGINRNEKGELKDVLDEDNKPLKVVTVRGSYSYTDDNGNVETITYFADDNGYHAEGPSVPKVV